MLSLLRNRVIRSLEIHRTKKAIATRRPPAPASLIRVSRGVAVWRLQVPGQPDRYVKVSAGLEAGRGYVVHVDADAFYLGMLRAVQTLRSSSYGSTCMARKDMHRDHKFTEAAMGFASSASSPVPLAQPAIGLDRKKRMTIEFNDGTTRTYWLLANGCRSFPVEISHVEEANLLAEHAGVGMVSFKDLLA